jgi:hypothetical protein
MSTYAAAMAHRIALAGLAVLELQSLPACAVLPDSLGTPAVIAGPTAESRRELARIIHEALGDVPVTLADDALTDSSLLSFEHALRRDPEGRTLNGRDLSRPETFELFKRGSHCVLVRLKTGRSWTLHHTPCVAAPARTSP